MQQPINISVVSYDEINEYALDSIAYAPFHLYASNIEFSAAGMTSENQ